MHSNKIESTGRRIQTLREEADMTQAALANAAGVSRETINHWESNTREIKATQLLKLADIFKVSCDFILRGVETGNVDIHMVTGLSGKAIELLITAKREKEACQRTGITQRYYFSDILSLLLEYLDRFPELESSFKTLLNKNFDIGDADFEEAMIERDSIGLLSYIQESGAVLVGEAYRDVIEGKIANEFQKLTNDLTSTINPSYRDNMRLEQTGTIFQYSAFSFSMGDTIINRMKKHIDDLDNKGDTDVGEN